MADQVNVSLAEQYKKLMLEVDDVLDDITASINKLAAGQQEVLNYEKQGVTFANQERRLKADIAKLTDKNGKLLKAENSTRLANLKAAKISLQVAKDQAKMTGKVGDAMKSIQEQVVKLSNP